MALSPEADRRTLIRRLTYDLHGLPPTIDEVDAFLQDERTDAYERLVDRLLGSPRYGERWGRHWLDVVHFGESHGYDKDKPRLNAWPYRDYVIRSLNADKPYSRFVEEQIAGDTLFQEDPDGVVALGFIAAGPWDFVGHVELPESKTDGLIARYNDRDDIVSTVMSTFQSLTVHCARCHDHKFDPITMRDYYRLQAVFAGVDRADRPYDADGEVHRRRRLLDQELREVEAKRAAVESVVAKLITPELQQLDSKLASLKQQLADLPVPKNTSPSNGYHSAIEPTPNQVKWVQLDLGSTLPLQEIRLHPARPTDFPDTPGFGFPLRYRVELSDDVTFARRSTLVDHSSADEPFPGDQPILINGGGQEARYVRITATRLWKRTDDYVFALAEAQVWSDGKNVARGVAVTALDSIEAGRWSTKYLTDGFSSRRGLDAASSDPDGQKRRDLEMQLLQLARDRETLVDALLDESTLHQRKTLEQARAEIQRLIADLPAPSFVYAGASAFKPQGSFSPSGRPRPVHLLNRGDVKQPLETASPGALDCLPTLAGHFELAQPDEEALRRAALARWITDPRNPITRRSIVNRIWQYHFGRGIVDTPNDFGHMGAEPSHPELLDWLAAWFLENGESLKQLHRLILTSSVYRQSSSETAGSRLSAGGDKEGGQHSGPQSPTANSPLTSSLDGDNRYLWRMNRMRLDAESIRDAALFIAGRMDLAMGGPSVQQFFFKDDHSPVYDYTQFDWENPNARRRSVYRFIVRSVPDPFMESFDCADACQLTPKRNTTLTALQALSLLNNPLMVRQAEHIAARVRRATSDPPSQIARVFELALGRPPSSDESQILGDYLEQHGLENVCRLILNSNEFLFVD